MNTDTEENPPSALEDHLRQLEELLLEPEFRRLKAEVAPLLAEDFREFGGSGRSYDKAQILQLLERDFDDSRREMSQFQIQVLAPDVVLATYRVTRWNGSGSHQIHSLRSSIWKFEDGRWQMTFHQGTPTESD